jgi:bacteriocin-like protein
MNTGENYRELSDDELNQVAGGGPVAHQAYLGSPIWISGAVYHWEVPTMTALNYPFPLPSK